MRQRFGGETMRKVIEPQMEIGEISIPDVQIDLTSRDEIPKLLIGLQELYRDQSLRKKVFEALKDLIRPDINPNRGRKGMNLWTILVLGVLRLNCNWDFDKLVEIANNHITLRLILGHSLLASLFVTPSKPSRTISSFSLPKSLINSTRSWSTMAMR